MNIFKLRPNTLLLAQIIAHLAWIPLLLYGAWYHLLLVFVVYFITGCFGMTMTNHRLLSHKSWNAPNWFTIFGSLASTYGLVGSTISWVAIHRQHHRFTDRDGDPHSPVHGFVRAQWFSMYHGVNVKYAVDLIRDKFHVFLHQKYFLIHLFIFAFWLMIDPMLLVACYLAPAALLWEMGSFINTINHKSMIGYRNFDTPDNSRNVSWLGYLMWGEGWHNNHHYKASDPRFGLTDKEFDMGWFFIKRLQNVEKA